MREPRSFILPHISLVPLHPVKREFLLAPVGDVSVYFILSSKSTKFLFLQRNLRLKMALSREKGQKQSHCDNARNDKITLILTFLSGEKKIFILIRRNSDTNNESESRVSRQYCYFFINFACLTFRFVSSSHCSSHCGYLDGS